MSGLFIYFDLWNLILMLISRPTVGLNAKQLRSQDIDLVSLDMNKEKRTQKFLLLILGSHFLSVLPINILK